MDVVNTLIKGAWRQLGLEIQTKGPWDYMPLFEGSLVGELFLEDRKRILSAVWPRELPSGDYQDCACESRADFWGSCPVVPWPISSVRRFLAPLDCSLFFLMGWIW